MKNAILIPSYCPNEKIIILVKELLSKNFAGITIVDDGSGPKYEPIFKELALLGCHVVKHDVNKGKGAALKTGIRELITTIRNLDGIITADGDGQHAVPDIYHLSEVLIQRPDSLLLGVRDFSQTHVPFRSRFGNGFSSFYFRLSTHISCPDTQTGLRAIPKWLFPLALHTDGDRYEYEMNFLMAAAKSAIPIGFVPIETIYDDGSSGSHFHPIKDSIRIYKTPLKYLCSSLLCAFVDLLAFTVLSNVNLVSILFRVLFATVSARILSGCLNFYMNQKWSFNSKNATGKRAVKYTSLFIFQMLLSWILVSTLSFIPIPLTMIKIPVDCGLFIFSYFMQLNWVFGPDRKFSKEVVR